MDSESRQLQLNKVTELSGNCVLYVMSRDQRVDDNHALLQAQALAIEHKVPLAVVFCLLTKTGYRSYEQYQWMLSGLREIETKLGTYNIPFIILLGDPKETLTGMLHHTNPIGIYFDMNPLCGPRMLQKYVAKRAKCPVFVIDTHNIVPIWLMSDKQEYAARTIRNKINRLLPLFIHEPTRLQKHPFSWPGSVKTMADLESMISDSLAKLPKNGQKLSIISGERAAKDTLQNFLDSKLQGYAVGRNDPSEDGQSGLSPYLHFGQISRLRIALMVHEALQKNNALKEGAHAFLEELIIRSALSDNYCYFNSNYKSLKGAPLWAQKSLAEHASDPREYMYTYSQFRDAQTHDTAWNAAQIQLLKNGKMHGYMRMYWAKKVLEWSETPQKALLTLIRLNDFYSIDGGDPNGYVGILWSIAGLHDRPWFNRSIYGSIRYMNYNGLKRKCNIDKYIEKYGE